MKIKKFQKSRAKKLKNTKRHAKSSQSKIRFNLKNEAARSMIVKFHAAEDYLAATIFDYSYLPIEPFGKPKEG